MSDDFIFRSEKFDKSSMAAECTRFTLSNGYRSFLGSVEFLENNGGANMIAGIFDKNDSAVTELVKCPNPLDIRLYSQNENGVDNFSDLNNKITDFRRELDMKSGTLFTSCEVESSSGKRIRLYSERYVSLKDRHRWAGEYRITPLNFSGQLIIENMIEGDVRNSDAYSFSSTEHLCGFEGCDFGDSIFMTAETKDERYRMAEICGLKFEELTGNMRRKIKIFNQKISEFYFLKIDEGNTVKFNKYGITATSRDGLAEGLRSFCRNRYLEYASEGYVAGKQESTKMWENRWTDMDIAIEGDEKAQTALRFSLFQLASCSNAWDSKVSIAAKGMHGEGYKGHVFWDTEIFMLPFFIYNYPEIARNLLMYRYHTLKGARRNSEKKGYTGAMFAWESAVDGAETTPEWGVNYKGEKERIWTGDEEIHISGDVFYAVWNYWRATGDDVFMYEYGLEILLEICVFIVSRLESSAGGKKYHISSVMGPDEFHPHVDDNFYTNFLFKWCLKKIVQIYHSLKSIDGLKTKAVLNKKEISENELYIWREISNGISVTKSADGRVIEQFEGYFGLEDLKITGINGRGLPEWPDELDLGKIHETQLIKQPDVLMLMYLLSEEFSEEELKDNFDYYESRTMHKSSLSPCIHSILGIAVGKYEHAYDYFMKTVLTDMEDNQGNTADGLHAASAGGAWLSAVNGFGRFFVNDRGEPNFSPWIPEKWNKLKYSVKWRKSVVKVEVSSDSAVFTCDGDLMINVYGRGVFLEKDKATVVRVKT